MRPMSRASQLAALVVGSRDGERVLDACAAPGGKTLLLAGEITAVEVHPGRARQLAEEMPANVRVVTADVRELDETGFDRALVDAPCSGLGVLARRPDLRWRAKPLPELQLELLQAAAKRTKPGGTIVYAVCTLNADENEAVVDALGLPVEPLGDEWPAVRAPAAAGVPAHAARPRPDVGVLHRRGCVTSTLMPWRDWIRTVEVEPSLYGADFSRLGEQIDALLDAGCRVFHFDVGDGHFVEPITIGPIVLQSISPRIHARGGALDVHLMVERPAKYFEAIAAAGGDSVTFHFEAVDDVHGDDRRCARARACRQASPSIPRRSPSRSPRSRAARTSCSACRSTRATRASRFARRRSAASSGCALRCPPTWRSRSTAGSARRTSRELRDRGASLFVAASSIFARDDQPAAYRELVRALA